MSSSSVAYLYKPSSVDGILEAIAEARSLGKTVALKGAGNSYGDAFQNAENVVIDLSRIMRVLEYDPVEGLITCEPGVTIRDIWRYVIGDGWWPPVVSGTSLVTIGGALAANIHGKNNVHAGPIGEHVVSFDLLLPSGQVIRCDPNAEPELFHSVIGSFGLLGVIVSATLRLTKVHSGQLNVESIAVNSLASAFETFESRTDRHDYIVGWIDAFASGSRCGRGLIHVADYAEEGEDPHPEESLRVEAQQLPDTVAGWLARSKLWRIMRPFVRPTGMRVVNYAKCVAAKREHGKQYKQTLVAFNFLLDSAPNWKWSYRPGALIQYQSFVPKDNAATAFERIITLSQDRGLVPYLAVMKRHRPDGFMLSHAVDGYSLALDFHVTRKNQERVKELTRALDDIVLANQGKFYFAKDSTLMHGGAKLFLGEDVVDRFIALKKRLDPEAILQSELSKRVFGEFEPAVVELSHGDEEEHPVG
jgi:FAD/FMN-containing dehydrogenase